MRVIGVIVIIFSAIAGFLGFISYNWQKVFPPGSSTDLISVITLFFVILGALNFLLYELVKKEVFTEVQKISEEERTASNAMAYFVSGHVMWLYYLRHVENRIKERKLAGDEKKDAKKHYIEYLNDAIKMAEHSVQNAVKLNKSKYEAIICKCKNNLAFFLAVKGNDSDKDAARNLGNYIYKATSGKYSDTIERPYVYKATRALVLWRFNNSDGPFRKKPYKKEAYRITKELLENDEMPSKELERLKELWKFIEDKSFDQILKEYNND